MTQVVEVIRRGRRGQDGASGVISTLRISEDATLAIQNRGFAVIADDDVTVTLPPSTAVGQGWSCTVFAIGGDATLSSESDIDGSGSDYLIPQGASAQVFSDGEEYLLQFFLSSNVAAVGTNSVANESGVSGATATAALNAILALLGAWGGSGSSPLLANLDATNTAANLYRFDGTTTGTRPSVWASGDDGVVLIMRQTATQALMIGKASGVDGIFYREIDTTWGSWARLDVPSQNQADWNTATSTEESKITPAKLAAAIDNRKRVYQVSDRKSSGTDGGGATATTWVTRDLNTVDIAGISGVSLASNVVTGLPAGRYRATITAQAYRVGGHRVRLYNVTGSTAPLIGTNAHSQASADTSETVTEIDGEFTLSEASNLRIEHWAELTRATDGFGRSVGTGGNEVYTVARFEWLGPN